MRKISNSGRRRVEATSWNGWLICRWGEDAFVYDIWLDPKTGDDVHRCPWLRKLPKKKKYVCRIHDVKPWHCREYPISQKHAEDTGCRGFD